MPRFDDRTAGQIRPVKITTGFVGYPHGSCLIEMGRTRALCAATYSPKAPNWLAGGGNGWVTAEYGMLPTSAQERMRRETGNSRATEIQRLIGRSLRQAVDMTATGECTFTIDCDIIQADGGTRCAAITGGFIALVLAADKLAKMGLIPERIIKEQIAAVSVGIVNGEPVCDLNYEEDSRAEVDMNFVMNGRGLYVEIQGSAEKGCFSEDELTTLKTLARDGINELMEAQRAALGEAYERVVRRD